MQAKVCLPETLQIWLNALLPFLWMAYNLDMPTPFYHLNLAEDLLVHPELPATIRTLLVEQRSAFLMGNTAPDVQNISGQSRELTHFFDLPIWPRTCPAWEKMLIQFPGLSHVNAMGAAQVAFLAGYLCHLQVDWWWVLKIFAPIFGPTALWSTFSQRLFLHNVLRSYLDQDCLDRLPLGIDRSLQTVIPSSWLPFVQDEYLEQMRDWLVSQLQPGASVQTVEVFAQRQGISPQAYYDLIQSETRMEEEILSRLPVRLLEFYREQVIDENVGLLKSYLVRYELI